MKHEGETKEKLLNSAKKEFLEKGYLSASLRSICKNAGVTTGALYFFFKDKEDLFANLVQEPLNKIYSAMVKHYDEELNNFKEKDISIENIKEHSEAMSKIIEYIFKYHDEFELIINKSQGSRFEKSIDEFIEITEKHYRILADKMSAQFNVEELDDYMIHWISHIHIYAFIHIITHELSKEDALIHMNIMIKYFLSGWYGMFSEFKR